MLLSDRHAWEYASKIVRTDLTNENLAYLVLVLGVELSIRDIPTSAIISCITNTQDIEYLMIPTGLISQLNTTLNDIKELPSFIEVIYPLCANKNINKQDLNSLAATFYAKLSSDMREGVLATHTTSNIYTPSIAQKYYYLLCLFSISNRNKSPELLEQSWKHCAHIFNNYENEACHTRDDWFTKIAEIEHSEEYTQLVVSSIIDGSIFRGLDDRKEIFKKFHNLLLFFITFQDNTIKTTDIEDKINQLKDKGTYYKWLIDREQSRLFPTSKKWFESNIIENNSILLRKNDEILFRKPTSSFSSESNPINEHNGYSEILVNYKGEKLKSFTDIIKEKSVLKKLRLLVNITKDFEEHEIYPNIFCNAHILNENTLIPFNQELNNLRNLIIERQDGSIEKFKNNKVNFIKAFFNISSQGKITNVF